MITPNTLALENLLNVLQQSYAIQTHQEYCEWMQSGVQTVIPHNVLLACWGSYGQLLRNTKLNYNVASASPDIETECVVNHLPEADLFMHNLHKAWYQNEKRWFVINDIQQLSNNHLFKPSFWPTDCNLNAFLVYGVSDIRSNSECLYVFFTKQHQFETENIATGYIMPHIDSVLRRIQYDHQVDAPGVSSQEIMLSTLTKKELQVLDFLRLSKSNKEISQMLNISPNTTKAHLSKIFHKLNVKKRMQAVDIYNKDEITKSIE